MKILLTLFDIQDYGGIVGDIEFLGRGLREAGHECDLVMLRCIDAMPYEKKFNKDLKGDYPSIFGGRVNTLRGWDGIDVWGYGSRKCVDAWRKFASEYDLVIHEIPGPPHDDGDWWRKIYELDTCQIIAAHDAHFREHYSHINEIAPRITAITCTNHAGYVALEHCPIPRAFIGAAHALLNWETLHPWNSRVRRSVCAHVWKAWKQNHKVVAAGPYLARSVLTMGGDGIEARYMRSKDKCKPKYVGLWDAAFGPTASAACKYRGLMGQKELYELYQQSRVMVDMSYSKKFAKLGNHFNRSILEAANNGCISICTIENMRENNPQVPLFKDGVTHIGVHADITPRELAEVMDWANNDVKPASAEEMVANVRKILADHFDYRKTSMQYLDLAKGLPAGIYPVLEVGKAPT